MSNHLGRGGSRTVCVLAILAAGLASPAGAQERPSIQALSCNAARALVSERGAVVMSTGINGFERLVRDQAFCALDDTTSPAYEASADERQCFVGYRCRPIERGESRD